MRSRNFCRLAFGVISLVLALGRPLSATVLDIQPVTQETPVWCWVAVGAMVFDHYGVSNVNPGGDYQCGIIGLLASGTWANACAYRCELCQVPAGSAQGVVSMIRDYPQKVANTTGEETPRLEALLRSRPLSPEDVISEIEDGNPVIAGISPGGRPYGSSASAHVALIIGYRGTEEDLELRVNDPYPFNDAQSNPYLAAGGERANRGSYWIEYSRFKQSLSWAESFVIQERGSIRPAVGRSCCLPTGRRCGPFLDQPALPLGSACSCQYGNPYASGSVCR